MTFRIRGWRNAAASVDNVLVRPSTARRCADRATSSIQSALVRGARTTGPLVGAATVIVLLAATCTADVIHFKYGARREGIVLEETEKIIQFRTFLGTMVVSRDKVEKIERYSDEENSALEKEWAEEKARRREGRKKNRLPEAEEKREPGVVKPPEGAGKTSTGEAQTEKREGVQAEPDALKTLKPSVREELASINDRIQYLKRRSLSNVQRIESIRQQMAQSTSIEQVERLSIKIDRIREEEDRLWKEIDDLRKRKKELLGPTHDSKPAPQ